MNSKKLAKIKEICEQNDMANADAIAAIKEVLEIDNYPNVSKLSNGEAFTFKGIKFVKIGEEQGGYLCVAAAVLFDSIFDENNNNYSKSEIKNKLNQRYCHDCKITNLNLIKELLKTTPYQLICIFYFNLQILMLLSYLLFSTLYASLS